MAKETSSIIFKKLVDSPVGIISEFITNKISSKFGYEPLNKYFHEIQTGKTPPMSNPKYYDANDIEWVKPSDIGFEKYITASNWISNKTEVDNKATIYKPNTVLIVCIGGGIGRLGIVNKKSSSNQQITGILFDENVLAEYVYYYFLPRYKVFEKEASKSTLPIINQKGLGSLDFVCPELSAQKEIVRYLDYCKECLDNEEYPLKTDFELYKDVFDFANRVFKTFYTQKTLLSECQLQLTHIENLTQAILQEAVQGKLAPQDPNDEPATELLKRIKEEKKKVDNSKKQKPLPPIKPEEIPFEIPDSWVWCRLGEIGKTQTGTTPPTANKKYFGKDIPFVKPADISISGINYYNEGLTLAGLEKGVFVEKDSLLMVCIGGSIGKSNYTNRNISCNQQINTIKGYCDISGQFLQYFLQSTYFQKAVWSKSSGGTTPIINKSKWESILIPLPPLPEQKRIVAEIEKQLAKTEQLKKYITSNQEATEQLLKALLHEAFEGGK
jgi:type I restriction enzyme S subunit